MKTRAMSRPAIVGLLVLVAPSQRLAVTVGLTYYVTTVWFGLKSHNAETQQAKLFYGILAAPMVTFFIVFGLMPAVQM